MELNLKELNKEKNGIIKMISWVYTVQDKVKKKFHFNSIVVLPVAYGINQKTTALNTN